jgi:hypothetical protein
MKAEQTGSSKMQAVLLIASALAMLAPAAMAFRSRHSGRLARRNQCRWRFDASRASRFRRQRRQIDRDPR